MSTLYFCYIDSRVIKKPGQFQVLNRNKLFAGDWRVYVEKDEVLTSTKHKFVRKDEGGGGGDLNWGAVCFVYLYINIHIQACITLFLLR